MPKWEIRAVILFRSDYSYYEQDLKSQENESVTSQITRGFSEAKLDIINGHNATLHWYMG